MRALRDAHHAERHSRGEAAPQAGKRQAPVAQRVSGEIEREQAESARGVAARKTVPRHHAGLRGFE